MATLERYCIQGMFFGKLIWPFQHVYESSYLRNDLWNYNNIVEFLFGVVFQVYSHDSLRMYFLNKYMFYDNVCLNLSHFCFRYIISHWVYMTHSFSLSMFLDRYRFIPRALLLAKVVGFPVNPHPCSCDFQRLSIFATYVYLSKIVYNL